MLTSPKYKSYRSLGVLAVVLLLVCIQILRYLGDLSSQVEVLSREVASLREVENPDKTVKVHIYYVSAVGLGEFQEKQLDSNGYKYHKFKGETMKLGNVKSPDFSKGTAQKVVRQTQEMWKKLLNRSALPQEPWWVGWEERDACWLDNDYWKRRSGELEKEIASCLNYVALLGHVVNETKGERSGASAQEDDEVFLLLDERSLLHQGWEHTLQHALRQLPGGWDALRLNTWGRTRTMDAISDAVFRVAVWWEGGMAMYAGAYPIVLSRKGVTRALQWWADRNICWLDAAIDSEELKVYALQKPLATALPL